MEQRLPNDWQEVLHREFEQDYWKDLVKDVEKAYEEKVVYPPKNLVFNAFKYCSFKNLKVVVIGQDPYHGAGQANGLCFSYVGTQRFPPSLKNIYKEVENDLAVTMPKNMGDLSFWAQQGVLLLNATLTVVEGKPNSHQKLGWKKFTDAVIQTISKEKEDVVFLLWGGFAQKKSTLINTEKHYILQATHPSPLGANKGGWFGCKHFSKTNAILEKLCKKQIEWKLIDKNQPPTLFTL